MNTSQKSMHGDNAAMVAEERRRWQASAAKWAASIAGLVLLLVVASTVSYLIGTRRGGESPTVEGGTPAAATRWTCSMHPQVDLPEPGKCPICFMPLIPMTDSAGSGHPRELVMTPAAMALAQVETTTARRQFVTNTIRTVGKVDYDETKLAYITAWVPGRLDRLFIDYTGVTVRKGDHLVEIYSPDLVRSQRELIAVWADYEQSGGERKDQALRTLKSTEEKLRLLGLTADQIETIKTSGSPSDRMTVYAPSGGVVIHKNASEGMYVQTGTQIYTIADLSQVWVYIDAYESDVAWLRYGQQVEFTTETYPGEIFKGRIAFIDPVLNEKTRTVKVRVNVPNNERRLKPGMFVRAIIKSRTAEGGQAVDESMAGKWISPHHPEIVRDGPGTCPICGVDLVPAEELGFIRADAGAEPPLVIPATAPLLTGKRAVVYVQVPKTKQPTFHGREVLLGHRAGDFYIVRHGLAEGEEVVTRGNFKIDSALQIAAKPSMMSPDAGRSPYEPEPTASKAALTHVETSPRFRVELNPALQAYLAASEALAEDDLKSSREALDQLITAIAQPETQSLRADGRSRFKTISDSIIVAAHETRDAADRGATRRLFQHLSAAMVQLVQNFGHALDHPVYEFHCTMAFDNQGAGWLQAGETTRNPYFGPAMLACGDPMATFHPQAPLIVPEPFRMQLATLYDAYLKLQSELAADRPNESVAAAQRMASVLETTDPKSLDERAGAAWMLAQTQMSDALKGDLTGMEIGTLRVRFEPLSLTMLGVADHFGHAQSTPLYKAYCPMAFDDKGAPWLQADEKIANPYFGAKMLRCGSIERVFEPADDAKENR